MYRKLYQTADQIEAVLRERKAPAAVIGGRVLPGFIEMLLQLAPGTRVNQVKALQADLALALGNANVRVTQQGSHLAVQIPRAARSPVRLSALLASLKDIPPYTAVLGLAEDGAPLLACLTSPEVAHILIAGTTGSGKTSLAHTILLSLCQHHRPSRFGLVIIDPKRSQESPFVRATEHHRLLDIAHTTEEAIAVLRRVVAVMEQRNTQLEPQPRVAVYVDEVADLVQTGGSAVVDLADADRPARARGRRSLDRLHAKTLSQNCWLSAQGQPAAPAGRPSGIRGGCARGHGHQRQRRGEAAGQR
jgi:S-DNA-T family DNA segregation ATPase FtsK/SpoIIIE